MSADRRRLHLIRARSRGFAIVAALALAASAVAQRPFDEGRSGAELFDQFCAACHGPAGKGDGPVAPTLNAAVPDLTRLSERNGGKFPADDVRAMIDGRAIATPHGTRLMPVWGLRFWVDEGADIQAEAEMRSIINRLVSHLQAIQDDPTAPR